MVGEWEAGDCTIVGDAESDRVGVDDGGAVGNTVGDRVAPITVGDGDDGNAVGTAVGSRVGGVD